MLRAFDNGCRLLAPGRPAWSRAVSENESRVPLVSNSEDICVSLENFAEEIQVLGRDLVDRVKALIHEGNVNRIIIKDDKGQTFVEIPVTVAAVGAVAAPVLAAIGALSALVAKFKIVVERSEPKPAGQPESAQAQSK